MITLKRYYDRLKAHDWFWYMSDDRRSCQLGSASQKELKLIADTHGGEYGALYDAFDIHYQARVKGIEPLPPLPQAPEYEELKEGI